MHSDTTGYQYYQILKLYRVTIYHKLVDISGLPGIMYTFSQNHVSSHNSSAFYTCEVLLDSVHILKMISFMEVYRWLFFQHHVSVYNYEGDNYLQAHN